jgi:hypothetical protein
MQPDAEAPRPKLAARELGLIGLGVLLLHVVLAARFPIIYGGDTILRIVNFPRILISYQLPLLQLLIHAALRWLGGPGALWVLMAVVAAAGAAGLHALVDCLASDRAAARSAALLYALHPFVLYYGRVPYQEPLLLACLFWGFWGLFTGRTGVASLTLGAAALTRYEGWLAAIPAALYWVFSRPDRGQSLRSWIGAAWRWGWAPALWIAWHRGASPGGTFLVDFDLSLARLYRPYFIVKSTLWWSGAALTALALVGLAAALSRRDAPIARRMVLLILFAALYLAALVFSGHGVAPDAERLVTEREAFVPVGLLAVCAGLGAAAAGRALAGVSSGAVVRFGATGALLLIAAVGLSRGVGRIALSNRDPQLRTDYEVARCLRQVDGAALILAAPLPRAEIDLYLARAETAGGAPGAARARALLGQVVTTPFDYQRVVAHAWDARSRILSSDLLRGSSADEVRSFLRDRSVRYTVVFSDFTPAAEHERVLLALGASGRTPWRELRYGPRSAAIYDLNGARGGP